MVDFAHIHEKWLWKRIRLPNGIPVKQTVINLLSPMDSEQFGQCVVGHIKDLHPESARQLIAIGGKTIWGSGKSNSEQEHCLSARAVDAGVTLSLEFVGNKSNEIPSIPILPDELELKGHVFPMDAWAPGPGAEGLERAWRTQGLERQAGGARLARYSPGQGSARRAGLHGEGRGWRPGRCGEDTSR